MGTRGDCVEGTQYEMHRLERTAASEVHMERVGLGEREKKSEVIRTESDLHH